MECKNCKTQLEEGVTLCPGCGTDNTPAAEETPEVTAEVTPEEAAPVTDAPEQAVPETAAPEMKPGIVLSPGKLVLIIVSAVLLTALVVALVLQGMGVKFRNDALPSEPQQVAEGLVQASGDASSYTCKSSYTVSDEEVIANMATVVATAGDAQLTNAELQIYYRLKVQNFLSQYGNYAMYLGLDYTQPLDTQICGVDNSGMTWEQYFLTAALAD